MYEVVIGGMLNQRSMISDCNQCTTTWSVNNSPLSDIESRPFWITWYLNSSSDADNNYGLTIRSGTGSTVLQNEFMSWYDPQPHDINYVGISTGWGANGTWMFSVGKKIIVFAL
jgi:Farnesoic acid 0-methyl transferase